MSVQSYLDFTVHALCFCGFIDFPEIGGEDFEKIKLQCFSPMNVYGRMTIRYHKEDL